MDTATSLVSSSDMALRLGVSERCVRKWAQKGVLRSMRIGKLWRFDPTHFPQTATTTPPPPLPTTHPPTRRSVGAQARAETAIRTLLNVGCQQKEIAQQSGLSPAVISRILSPRNWPVSNELAARLEQVMRTILNDRLRLIVGTLGNAVRDTYAGHGVKIDKGVLETVGAVVIEGLATPGTSFPRGIDGAVITIGEEWYLIRAADPRIAIHELRLVIEELRDRLSPESEFPDRPRPAF